MSFVKGALFGLGSGIFASKLVYELSNYREVANAYDMFVRSRRGDYYTNDQEQLTINVKNTMSDLETLRSEVSRYVRYPADLNGNSKLTFTRNSQVNLDVHKFVPDIRTGMKDSEVEDVVRAMAQYKVSIYDVASSITPPSFFQYLKA
jgi:hypothetical protein